MYICYILQNKNSYKKKKMSSHVLHVQEATIYHKSIISSTIDIMKQLGKKKDYKGKIKVNFSQEKKISLILNPEISTSDFFEVIDTYDENNICSCKMLESANTKKIAHVTIEFVILQYEFNITIVDSGEYVYTVNKFRKLSLSTESIFLSKDLYSPSYLFASSYSFTDKHKMPDYSKNSFKWMIPDEKYYDTLKIYLNDGDVVDLIKSTFQKDQNKSIIYENFKKTYDLTDDDFSVGCNKKFDDIFTHALYKTLKKSDMTNEYKFEISNNHMASCGGIDISIEYDSYSKINYVDLIDNLNNKVNKISYLYDVSWSSYYYHNITLFIELIAGNIIYISITDDNASCAGHSLNVIIYEYEIFDKLKEDNDYYINKSILNYLKDQLFPKGIDYNIFDKKILL